VRGADERGLVAATPQACSGAHIMRKPIRQNIIFWIVGLLFVLYAGSYVVLSLRGRYEPFAFNLDGVSRYRWAPKGFVYDLRWNQPAINAYVPLYMLDNLLWHTPDEAWDGHYPINKVPVERIGELYRARK
jgi:hypothetical protein